MYFHRSQVFIIYFFQFIFFVNSAGSVTDVTSNVGLNNVDGVMAVFCDFDSDRDTDILVISTTCKWIFFFKCLMYIIRS